MSLDHAGVAALRRQFSGTLVTAHHPEYEQSRRVWNAMIDRYPGVLARCRTAADVVVAVNWAREHKVPIAVRGGGHNVAGKATCDGGIVIDFVDMKAVTVNPEKRHGPRGAGRPMDRLRQSHTSARTRHDRGHDRRHGHCRTHARRRLRVARRSSRHDGGQRARRRPRARERTDRSRQRVRECGSLLGNPRRRRQFRRRHGFRLPVASSWTDGRRRIGHASDRTRW